MHVIDVTGKRFGKWTVLERAANNDGHARWLCRCECGNQRTVDGKSLRRGDSTKCDHCKGLTHGHSRRSGHSLTYDSWIAMWQCCTNPHMTHYRRYGGRGIAVCARWESFELFLKDMGERSQGMTLDRINNDGNYEPGNVRWATRKGQARTHRHDAVGRFATK